VSRIEASVLESLVITDSIEPPEAVRKAVKIRLVSIAPLFAQAILNVGNGTSVSSLFGEKTLGPIYEAFYRFT
jgi:ribose-phosphate pyrophosphokinase